MSEKKKHNDFPFQRKEGVVVWRGRSWGVREVGVAADMRIYCNLHILHQK